MNRISRYAETHLWQRLNDASVNVKAMQEMPGHKDIDTTMRICVDASENIISHAMNGHEDMMSKMYANAIPHTAPFPQSSVKICAKSMQNP